MQISRIAPNGVFEIVPGKLYDKVYNFSDINYSIQDFEEQEEILDVWCRFLTAMKVPFKIVIGNHKRDMDKFRKMVFYDETGDPLDTLRQAFNDYFTASISDIHEGIEQQRYLVVSAERQDYGSSVEFFTMLENTIRSIFRGIGSAIRPLSAEKRLEVLHRIYMLGHESEYHFDMDSAIKNARDFKNVFLPDYIRENEDHLESDGMYHRVLYIKDWPFGNIQESFLKEITTAPYHTVTTLDIVPIDKADAVKFAFDKYMGVERTIAKMQRWRTQNDAILADIPFDKQRESDVLQSLYELLQSTDENLYYVGITILITAKSRQELENITESIKTIAAGHSMTLSPHWLRQMDAFKTTLPVAGRYIRTSRTLNTSSLTKLIPFNAQELLDDGGICYGRNQATGSMIFGNRRLLLNSHGFILAVSGSGKTFSVKTEIEQLVLRYPKDNILVIDPKSEYFDFIRKLGGEVIDVGIQSPHHINPLEFNGLAKTDPMAFVKQKSEFLLSLCDAACKSGISDMQRSIIDRCLNILYTRIFDKDLDISRFPPLTLKDFYGILKAQTDPEAQDLAAVLEIFITGSLDVFAHPTNVDIDNPRIVFGISGVSKDLWGIAMMTIMEFVRSRVDENYKKGVSTWFFCDEFHELLGKPYTEEYMENFWKTMRYMGCGCTGITQDISDLLENKRTRNMLANSEYILMLKQAGTDIDDLASLIDLSETQIGYVTNNPAGTGLIKFGGKIIPFDMSIPEDSLIYNLNNSDPSKKPDSE